MSSCDLTVNGKHWDYYASLGQTRRIKKSTKKRAKPWTAHLEYSLKLKQLLKLDDVRVRIRYGDIYAKTRDDCLDQEESMIVQFMKDVEEVLNDMKNLKLDLVHLPRLKGPFLHRHHFQDKAKQHHCVWIQEQMDRCQQREADENPCSFCIKEKKKSKRPDFNDKIVRSLFVSKLPNTRYQHNLQKKIKKSLGKDTVENKSTNPINTGKYWMKSYEKEEEEKHEWRRTQTVAVKKFTETQIAKKKKTTPTQPFGRKSKRKTSPIIDSDTESEYHSSSGYSSDGSSADRAPIPQDII